MAKKSVTKFMMEVKAYIYRSEQFQPSTRFVMVLLLDGNLYKKCAHLWRDFGHLICLRNLLRSTAVTNLNVQTYFSFVFCVTILYKYHETGFAINFADAFKDHFFCSDGSLVTL